MIVSQRGSLRHINPSINIDPNATPSFLKPTHGAQNCYARATRAMLDHARRGVLLRHFTINPALNMTVLALEELRANHAVHCSPSLQDFLCYFRRQQSQPL